MFVDENNIQSLSGERFQVVYRIQGNREQAYARALGICIEQTVEFPAELLPEVNVDESIVGRIEHFEECDKDTYMAAISYAIECASNELLQLLNVIFGNSSIQTGIRVEHLDLSESILRLFKGPRFGIDGIRKLIGVEKRPLLFTALKPMGLSAENIAKLAYQFALGGIDVIKDDHGLSNQCFSPYEERISLCIKAVEKANKETGYNCIYVPNISAPFDEIVSRARFAKNAGAKALMIIPGLTGFDAMREIAEDDEIALPIFSHPAFQGSYVLSDHGISHSVLFGQIARLAGADATIYPNFGGRFSFSVDECRQIMQGAKEPMGALKPIFPCPAGGMGLDSIPKSMEVYGNDIMLLIGGGLFKHGPDLAENSRYFRGIVENLSQE